MFLDMESGKAMAMGYMGGYTTKYPVLGQKEAERLGEAYNCKLVRELASGMKKALADRFRECSKRIVKDLESTGTVRTSVEAVLLGLYADFPDTLMAECIRTFPTVTSQRLFREEIETSKAKGRSVIASLHDNRGNRGCAYKVPAC